MSETGKTWTELPEAVAEVWVEGDEEAEARIAALNAENARLRAELHERIDWWRRRYESQNDELTAAEAARDEAVAVIEAMGRRLHVIDHGAIMPPFELCQDLSCQSRWSIIDAAKPDSRFWAVQVWRKTHPNHAPQDWEYGVPLKGEHITLAHIDAHDQRVKAQTEAPPPLNE